MHQAGKKANFIDLFNFSSVQMRAFHMSWLAFFLCFFAWFGIAPLMPIIRDELGLTQTQVGNTIIASVSITIFARIFIGWLCDRIGPRLSYTFLLTVGALPIMGVGLANSYESFLLFRLAMGAIGASFVITQYHTSVMFAPNCVGTANATVAGWGNLGGGVTQIVMPLIFAAFVALGFTDGLSWRLAMMVAGVVCFVTGIAYYFLTQDTPEGNFSDIKKRQRDTKKEEEKKESFLQTAKDTRVWILFLVYAACFGIEITINGIAALYFTDYFGLGLKTAGLVAGTFGLMNIFARSLGGIVADKVGQRAGLRGRVYGLFIVVLLEGLAIIVFSRMNILPLAIGSMILFSLFVQMSEGVTYSIVPFINPKAVGSVSGIVAAGGNVGAVAAGFLFRVEGLAWPDALLWVGVIVLASSFLIPLVRFSVADEEKVALQFSDAHEQRRKDLGQLGPETSPVPLLSRLKSIGPHDLLRVFMGGALAVKGVYFILNMDVVEGMLGEVGIGIVALSWYVVFAHIVGGACIMLGIATRIAVALNIPVILGAVFLIHLPKGMFASQQGLEFTILVLVALIVTFWSGSGKLSIDGLLRNKKGFQ